MRPKHIYRALIRIIADIDAPEGRGAFLPVAVIPAWNHLKPVVLKSWPPGFDMSKGDVLPYRCHGQVDLNAPDDQWEFDVEWCQ